MTQAHRTPAGGSAIDRERPISFTFDGVAYAGYEGDTLASALLANGVRLVGRSYKYHRPRGIVAAGPEEPNALVGVQRGPGRFTPNLARDRSRALRRPDRDEPEPLAHAPLRRRRDQ